MYFDEGEENSVVTDEKAIEKSFRDAQKQIKNKSVSRAHAENLMGNPNEILKARKFMANNPHLARKSETLTNDAKKGVNSMSTRKKNQMMRMAYKNEEIAERSSDKKIVRIARSNGKIVYSLFPKKEVLNTWESIQLDDDLFLIYDPAMKKKNTFANMLFDPKENISVGGDIYIYQTGVNGEIIDINIEIIRGIFSSLNK